MAALTCVGWHFFFPFKSKELTFFYIWVNTSLTYMLMAKLLSLRFCKSDSIPPWRLTSPGGSLLCCWCSPCWQRSIRKIHCRGFREKWDEQTTWIGLIQEIWTVEEITERRKWAKSDTKERGQIFGQKIQNNQITYVLQEICNQNMLFLSCRVWRL